MDGKTQHDKQRQVIEALLKEMKKADLIFGKLVFECQMDVMRSSYTAIDDTHARNWVLLREAQDMLALSQKLDKATRHNWGWLPVDEYQREVTLLHV